MTKIALIGFGEAPQAFAAGWIDAQRVGEAIFVFDIKSEESTQANRIREACQQLGVACASSRSRALAGKNAVFSLVTADQALVAARQVAPFIEKDALYFDCNSCSPATKAASSEIIDAAGGRYIDVAVMAPVYPARHQTPLLVAGEHADRAVAVLTELDMTAKIAGHKIGDASAIKMLRSVMIKGIEALTAECMLAARRAGVEQSVIASLQASDPGFNWEARFAYNLERMMVHGQRRAAELVEVAATLRDLGISDRMTTAAIDWQRQIADLDLDPSDRALGKRADLILEHLLA